MATPKRFSIQQVFEILLRKPADKSFIGYLDDCKTSNLNNEATLVYPTGGRGNVYIGSAFAHSRRARLEVTRATWTTTLLAAQVGTEVIVGATEEAVKYDILDVASDATNTSFTAVGATGAEIGFVYVVNADGTYGTQLVQDALVGAGKFTYTPATKLISFNVGELADGTKVACAYNFNTGATAQQINVEAGAIPATLLITAYGLVKDICTGDFYKCQIDGLAQLDANWSWALDAAGEPAVENFNLEFVRTCADQRLYTIIVYDEADAV